MRLIDADALLTDRMKSKYYHLKNGDVAVPIIDIEHAPTVDAVEVVRCRDCKYAKLFEDRDGLCGHPSNNAWDIFDEFYCGRGVKHE